MENYIIFQGSRGGANIFQGGGWWVKPFPGGSNCKLMHNSHMSTNLAFYSNELSHKKQSIKYSWQSNIAIRVHAKLHENLLISTSPFY